MARRNVSASDIDFSGYYNEPEVNPITMAMQLLGMEAKQEESDAAKLMSFMQMRSEEQRAEEELGLKREQLGETRAGNAFAQRLAQDQENRLARTATDTQELARQKMTVDALEKVAGVLQLSPEARLLLKNIPGMEEPFTRMEQETEMGAVLPQLQAAYAGKDPAKRDAAIKVLYGKMSPHARESAPWQDLNALIAPDVPRPAGATPTTVGAARPGPGTFRSWTEPLPPESGFGLPPSTVPPGYPLGGQVEEPGMLERLLELLSSDKSARLYER